ncbi:thiamine-monophosphate kinase [Halomonas cupida]|uniref:Thiamine-monophosphate kinase n=1 Tax=Halomonas cupida TaxID=44933 RepID=A0A1M7EYM1_9GAMM|nr:thiamine-phosphate kinase [Halomonas cupida]GEN23322.1 thiamine-monophosphate kinase [Halomonas cupida]SHL96821.1 thiamine-monophosphate kinase [Halomonas cupida]
MHGEFELITRWLAPDAATLGPQSGVALGAGDDACLLDPGAGQQLVVSVDTSVEGRHFPADAPAWAVGHRALAVSLSDLAAMGARPRWCLMSLALPTADGAWVAEFSRGFHALCRATDVCLTGGDVTTGERAVSVTVMGEIAAGQALRRDGARPGDVLAVTGALGGGAGGLARWQAGERDLERELLARYLLPQPRLVAGQLLVGKATAAIDVSDGLLADLGHVLDASGVGATLDVECLPLVPGLTDALGETAALDAALAGGDDYELLVTLAPESFDEARRALASIDLELTQIGHIHEGQGIQGIPPDARRGWQHFSGGTP